MRRERCTITARLAGPCACCRQPAWPAHVQSDGRILCADCCACGRGGAQAAGAHAAPGGARSGPAHAMPLGRATGAYIAPAGPGKAQIPPRPFRAILGPFPALHGPLCAAIRAALRPRLAARAATWPPAGATTWPARTRCHAARWPPPQGRLAHASLRRALCGKTFPCPNVSGKISCGG